MPEPEIWRRCPSCGASLRGQALFCPQCGAPLAQPKESSHASEDHHSAASAAGVNKREVPDRAQEGARPEAVLPQRRRSDGRPGQNTSGWPAQQSPGRTAPGSDASAGIKSQGRNRPVDTGSPGPPTGKTRKTIHRATAAARDALEDNVRPRVEKIRHASSIVLEEASDDPSLRFILVAGALFLLFILLLLISKVI